MGKKKEMSKAKKIRAEIKKKLRSAKLEAVKLQCECPHKSRNGKLWLKRQKSGGDRVVFKCRECGEKIDFTPVVNKDPREVKQYIKDTVNDFMNLCDIGVVTMNQKYDKKYSRLIAKAKFSAYQVKKLIKITLSDSSGKRRRKAKKGGNRANFIIGGGIR